MEEAPRKNNSRNPGTRLSDELRDALYEEAQRRRRATGKEPSWAALLDEAWLAYTSQSQNAIINSDTSKLGVNGNRAVPLEHNQNMAQTGKEFTGDNHDEWVKLPKSVIVETLAFIEGLAGRLQGVPHVEGQKHKTSQSAVRADADQEAAAAIQSVERIIKQARKETRAASRGSGSGRRAARNGKTDGKEGVA